MKSLSIGVIGAGHIAQTAHLPILARMQDATVTALCDARKSTVTSVAAQYGITAIDTDHQRLLARPDIDAVVIATPTDTHLPIGLAAIEAGKHLLIEKPLATSHKDAAALTRAAEKRGVVLMVGMNHRFKQDNTTLRSFIQSGELGDIFLVQASWLNYQSTNQSWLRKRERSGGGVFMDLGLVMLDLVLWLLDFPVAHSVSAVMQHGKVRDVEDSASCFFRLEGGTAVSLHCSWNAPVEKPQLSLDIVGTKGSASVNPLRIRKIIAGVPSNVTPVLPESHASIFRRSYEHQLRHFLGAIRGVHPTISTGAEAAARMRLVDAAYRASALGQSVEPAE